MWGLAWVSVASASSFVRPPPPAPQGPGVIVGRVVAWRPLYGVDSWGSGEIVCLNTAYRFAVTDVLRGDAVAGTLLDIVWSGCVQTDGTVTSWHSEIEPHPELGDRLLVYYRPVPLWGMLADTSLVFWVDDEGRACRPNGDWIAGKDGKALWFADMVERVRIGGPPVPGVYASR